MSSKGPLKVNTLRFVFIMYYSTSDICHLGEGYFCMKVNGESVAVVGGKVVADSSVKPTVGPVALQLALW